MPYKDTIDLAYLQAAVPRLDAALIDPPLCAWLAGRDELFGLCEFNAGRDPYAKQFLAYLRRNNLVPGRHKHEET